MWRCDTINSSTNVLTNLMSKKLAPAPSSFERNYKLQEEWDYIDDPTYLRSIGTHVCMTCSKFDYSSQGSFGSILFCNRNQKLIWHGQHLTHSCKLYQKKPSFGIQKKLIQQSQAA